MNWKAFSGVIALVLLVSGAPGAEVARASSRPVPRQLAAAAGINWGKPAVVENFSGTRLNLKRWFAYDDLHPQPGHPRRSPGAVRVGHGDLQLTGYVDPKLGDVSGGIGDRFHQAYGRWEVRFRADAGRGYAPVVLLWPNDGKWPDEGEIDLAEVFDPARRSAGEFLHYGHDNHQAGRQIKADFTQWHVIAVDWLPSHITFWLDGRTQWTVEHQADPRKNVVPSTPFRLALQNDQGCSGHCQRDKTTPRDVVMHVDWVKIYRVPAGVH